MGALDATRGGSLRLPAGAVQQASSASSLQGRGGRGKREAEKNQGRATGWVAARRFFNFFCNFDVLARSSFRVNEDFSLIIDFLERVGPEACGRGVAEPPSDAARLLEQLARGECDEQERRAVCQMLREHPAWMRWLAGLVKLERPVARAH